MTGLAIAIDDDDDDAGDRSEPVAAPATGRHERPQRRPGGAGIARGELEAPAAIGPDGSGYLMGSTLPALDDSQTYQLWGISGDVVLSLGVLGSSPGVVAFHTDEDLDGLAITQEISPGVISSANPPVLVGEVS